MDGRMGGWIWKDEWMVSQMEGRMEGCTVEKKKGRFGHST